MWSTIPPEYHLNLGLANRYNTKSVNLPIAETKRVQLLQPFTVLAIFKIVYLCQLGASVCVPDGYETAISIRAPLFKNGMYTFHHRDFLSILYFLNHFLIVTSETL